MNEDYKTYDEKNAEIFMQAIIDLANDTENFDNMLCYLSRHFTAWMKMYANTPEKLAAEMKMFSEVSLLF